MQTLKNVLVVASELLLERERERKKKRQKKRKKTHG